MINISVEMSICKNMKLVIVRKIALTYLILIAATQDLLILAFPEEFKLLRPDIIFRSLRLEILKVAPP